MNREEFDRAFDLVPIDDVIVFEFHSGFRVVVFDRLVFRIADGLCRYVEEDGEVCLFDASSVSRILHRNRPPMLDRLRPSANGKH